MAKLTAMVESHPYRVGASLRYHTGQQWEHLELETPAWFDWLAQGRPFRYTYTDRDYQQTVSFTVRPEKRGRQTYWWGWKTVAGRTRKKYLGAPDKLTQHYLDQTGQWFGQQVRANTPHGQSMRLYAITIDLVWLAERLLEGYEQPEKQADLYHRELAQLKERLEQVERELG